MKTYPSFIYGTAWKKESTRECVRLALDAGFTAIDTACQPKHYHEPGVGDALRDYFKSGNSRDSVWIQTKFTPIDGHDERVPYDSTAPVPDQVRQSFEKSLQQLGVDYIDSYLLHGPYEMSRLGKHDFEVWHTLESLHDSGVVKQIGISNVNETQLEMLLSECRIPPVSVQNRCFARQKWNAPVRALCQKNKIHYQGFSLLTANPEVFESALLQEICRQTNAHPVQVIFRFSQMIGITPLTGTTNSDHMRLDLDCGKVNLDPSQAEALEAEFFENRIEN